MEVPDISNIKKENTLLFYGRLTPMKRVEDAIKAFALIHKELPQYSLRIIGPAQEPTYFQSLQDLVKELGLEEKVEFYGGITLENRHLLAKHKLILIPSHKE
jgi:poly(glycerol-phosphate) alpha-glucosyltransferase